MRVPCIYRAGYNGAVIRSMFDIESGKIDKVPSSLFECKLPYDVSVMFRNISNDIGFSDTTLRLASNLVYKGNQWKFVFADYGNHIYMVDEKFIVVSSLNKDEQVRILHESVPNLFNVETYPIGFYRQKAVTFDVNPAGMQKLNLFRTQEGVFYYDGEVFKQPQFMCDIKPEYKLINLFGFMCNPDESVIGVATYKGKEVYIKK